MLRRRLRRPLMAAVMMHHGLLLLHWGRRRHCRLEGMSVGRVSGMHGRRWWTRRMVLVRVWVHLLLVKVVVLLLLVLLKVVLLVVVLDRWLRLHVHRMRSMRRRWRHLHWLMVTHGRRGSTVHLHGHHLRRQRRRLLLLWLAMRMLMWRMLTDLMVETWHNVVVIIEGVAGHHGACIEVVRVGWRAFSLAAPCRSHST